MYIRSMLHKGVRTGLVTLLAGLMTLTLPLETLANKYDIQVGYYRVFSNAVKKKEICRKAGLATYFYPLRNGTRVIIDTNMNHEQALKFIASHNSLKGAFPVKSIEDVLNTESDTGNKINLSKIKTARKTKPSLNKLISQQLSPGEALFRLELPYKSHMSLGRHYDESEHFADIMAPYIQQQYAKSPYNYNHTNLLSTRAKDYAEWIYEASDRYNIDPLLLLAVANHETYFMNIDGDINHRTNNQPNHSEGIFQILKKTQDMIYKDMKARDMLGNIAWRPGRDLKHYPKSQPFMAAHFLKYFCGLQGKDTYFNALKKYNGSYAYPPKVLSVYKNASRWYNKKTKLAYNK